jgi:hypothetical protein
MEDEGGGMSQTPHFAYCLSPLAPGGRAAGLRRAQPHRLVVRHDALWWSEWKDRLLKLGDYVFFGSSSGDESWGINWKREGEIIAYHHHMENEFVGDTIVEVYLADYAKYDDAN